MKHQVIGFKEFQAENLLISEPQQNSDNYISKISYKNKAKFFLQSCTLLTDTLKSDDQNFYLYLQIPQNPSSELFYTCIQEIEKQAIKHSIKKGTGWCTKLTEIQAEEQYQSILLAPKTLDASPRLKFKIPIVNNNIACTVFDKLGNKLTLKELTNANEPVVILLEINVINYHREQYYINFNVSQIKMSNYPKNPERYLFVDDSPEESESACVDIDSD